MQFHFLAPALQLALLCYATNNPTQHATNGWTTPVLRVKEPAVHNIKSHFLNIRIITQRLAKIPGKLPIRQRKAWAHEKKEKLRG